MGKLTKRISPIKWISAPSLNFQQGQSGQIKVRDYVHDPQRLLPTITLNGTLPSGCSFNGEDVSYDGAGAAASSSVTFTATAGTWSQTSSSTTCAIQASQQNNPPVWATIPPQSVAEGYVGPVLDLASYCTDPDGDTISYGASGLPTGLSLQGSVVQADGTQVAAPATTISVTADDGQGGFEPAITGEAQPEQYLTYDGGGVSNGGPNYKYWNVQLLIPWENETTGDFVDKNDTAQGPTPFSQSSVVSGTGQYVTVDATELVQRAVSSGVNKGFYVHTTGSFNPTLTCSGRLGANPPLLSVTTNTGTFNCAALSNANWVPSTSSTSPIDSRASFTVGSATSRYTVVLCDLSAINGLVQSATLSLYVTGKSGSNVQMVTFEANPPIFSYGAGTDQPQTGLAAQVGEENLPAHPDVFWGGDFAGTTFDWSKKEAYIPKLMGWVGVSTGDNTAEVLPDPDAPGTYYWRGMFVPVFSSTDPKRNAFGGGTRFLMPGDESDPLCPPLTVVEEAFCRFYLMLEDDFNTTADGNKLGIAWFLNMGYWRQGGVHGSYWQNVGGNGGDPGDGKKYRGIPSGYDQERFIYEGNMQRMEAGISGTGDNPYYGARPWTGYNYNLDQFNPDGTVNQPFPGIVAYNNVKATAFRKNRWYCIEQHLKMNSIDLSSPDALGNGEAIADGILETWVNGVLVDRRDNYRWRRHPEMGIAQVTSNWYMGGREDMPDTMHWRMNHWVVAKQYIGPRVRA